MSLLSSTATESAAAALRNNAYRLLARREHSARELRRKLLQKRPRRGRRSRSAQPDLPDEAPPDAVVAAAVDELLRELAASGAQSDARFAEALCRRRYQDGRGPAKLRHELAEHGIAAEEIDRHLAAYAGQWRERADEVRRRKFGDARPANYREWARQARFLQQRGFTGEHIEPFGG